MTKYQIAIKRFLDEYAAIPASTPTVRYEVIADDKKSRYCLFRYGLREDSWTHLCIFHINIEAGKVVVHQNLTDLHIDEELEALGIPKSDVVASVEELVLTS